jgi:hypothetical protein
MQTNILSTRKQHRLEKKQLRVKDSKYHLATNEQAKQDVEKQNQHIRTHRVKNQLFLL